MPDIDYFPIPSGSGGIGEGGAGDLIIGGLPFPWQDTVLQQYANSPRIVTTIAQFAAAMSTLDMLDDFYVNIRKLQTCGTFGLDVWGRIVGIGRVIPISPTTYFGFDEGSGGGLFYTGFDQGPFYNGELISTGFRLENDAYRQLIYAKAAANIWNGSIAQLNAILRILFPMRAAYVSDDGNMEMTYHFLWALSPVETSVAVSSGVLPRPCGVKVNYVQTP